MTSIDPTAERLWTIQDVSTYLGVPVETLRWWRKNKAGPPCRKAGRHLRYNPADVRAWFDEQAA
ncbi:helix-turn-helix domain-containing protein [Cryptosporangium aurantiacum]|uniref:Transcriptional regulator, AlpA family n=1 Tax=Cryptosporangium aurantiacum TaxID=134849 RepID=A0A1M7QTT4_9ACTN|nr:helix-turn-helix domain-containing protein [Cryptosporangium aurantiacum]SHN35248.1 transcriptional regulator, AlpA family [Cryptosporangium aurantiacum]